MHVIEGHLFYRELRKAQPALKLAVKSDSRLFRFLSWPSRVFLGVDILRHTVTTLGTTVWWPHEPDLTNVNDLATLYHEFVHVCDYRRHPVKFVLAYAFPQNLAVLALLAVGGIWWAPMLWNLVWLAALLPWPAPGRAWAERRGYTASLAAYVALVGAQNISVQALIRIFTGGLYYRMVWRQSTVKRWFYPVSRWRRLAETLPAAEALDVLKNTRR